MFSKKESKIIRKWKSISIPENLESNNIMEFLNEEYTNAWKFIDCFPEFIKDMDIYKQINIVYGTSSSKKEFLTIKNRFVRVMKILWAMDTPTCSTNFDLETILSLGSQKKIHKYKDKYIKKFVNNHKTRKIFLTKMDNLKDYLTVVEIGLKDESYPILYFEKMEMLIHFNAFNFLVFTNKKETQELLAKVVTTEGLYLWS